MHEMIRHAVKTVSEVGAAYLFQTLTIVFLIAIVLRVLVYYTVARELWFAKEFDKRAQKFLSSEESRGDISFFLIAKRLLEKTFYELFEVRAIMARRRPDPIMGVSDRVFLINQGAAWLVKDTLRQLKFLKHGKHDPDFMQITKNVFQNNPCFNRLFGIVPAATLNDILNILPSIMIIGGIFGTFLGIMNALPQLGLIDVKNVEATKQAMNEFLFHLGVAMTTSIIAIAFWVGLTFMNSLLSPERLFVQAVERYENVLAVLWNRSDDNRLPEDIPEFNEHKDPLDALAEQAVNRMLSGRKGFESEQRGNPPPAAPKGKAS
jgi:hypothetical protein